MPRDNRCMYMAHACFYVCCSESVGVCGNVCCVAVVVKVFLALESLSNNNNNIIYLKSNIQCT